MAFVSRETLKKKLGSYRDELLCDLRALVADKSRTDVETGSVRDIFDGAAHPYTRRLISCFPRIGAQKVVPEGIDGFPPNLIDPPRGCRFHPRCLEACDACREIEPQTRRISATHSVACHLSGVNI